MPGEVVCGDDVAVVRGETVTIVVADGLGHGPAAAEAARGFCDFAEGHPDRDLEFLLREGGAAIKKTRGVAAGILRIDEARNTVWFAGVGNIELRSLGGDFHPSVRRASSEGRSAASSASGGRCPAASSS